MLELALELMPMGTVAVAVSKALESWQRTALRKAVQDHKNAQKEAASFS